MRVAGAAEDEEEVEVNDGPSSEPHWHTEILLERAVEGKENAPRKRSLWYSLSGACCIKHSF